MNVGCKEVVDSFSRFGCDAVGMNRLHNDKSIRQVIMQLQERVESDRNVSNTTGFLKQPTNCHLVSHFVVLSSD